MPVNLSAPQPQSAHSREGLARAPAAVGPKAGFFAALLAGFATLIVLRNTAAPDLVMPVVATLFLIFAAVFGAIAWLSRHNDANGVTYRDVAGALVLIGVCAAAAIDSEQALRLVQGGVR